MTPLEQHLQQHMQTHGPLRLDAFMELALYDAEHGYYTTQNPFADFITAPELTPLFGEALAVWVVQQWEALGAPERWQLLECGPGQGTLLADILRTLTKIAPECQQGCQPTLLEVSPRLQKIQQEKLADFHPTWAADIQAVPNTLPTVLIANEFLDAMPVRQFQQVDAGWQERFVAWDEANGFHFIWQTAPDTPAHLTTEDGIVEISAPQINWLKALKQHFLGQKLRGVFIDYAVAGGDTLQAMKNHAFVPPLTHIGAADLTTHVNFPLLVEAAELTHTQLTDMSIFLTQHGFALRVQMLIEQQPAHEVELLRVAERLLSPEYMGTLFKCLEVRL